MRIACFYCGIRGNEEFSYFGDATLVRPRSAIGANPTIVFPPSPLAGEGRGGGERHSPASAAPPHRPFGPPPPRGGREESGPHADPSAAPIAEDLGAGSNAGWNDYVYLRDNPAGPHRELWQHVAGCRAWLVVTRDTRTHEILGVESARDVALTPAGQTP